MGNSLKETSRVTSSPMKLGQYEVISHPKIERHEACAQGPKTDTATPLRLGRHEICVLEPALHQSVARLGRHEVHAPGDIPLEATPTLGPYQVHAPTDIPLQTTPMLGPYKVRAVGNIPSQTIPMLGSYEVSEPEKALQQTIPMLGAHKARKSPKTENANVPVKQGFRKVKTYYPGRPPISSKTLHHPMRWNRYKLSNASRKGRMELSKRLLVDKPAVETCPFTPKPNFQFQINNEPTHQAETTSAKEKIPKDQRPPKVSANEAPARSIETENSVPEQDIDIDVYGPWTEEDEKNYWSEIIIA